MEALGAALLVTGIVKTYPGVTALAGVSLEVMPGEVHALLGENGAGKSTLLGVAAGSIVPDSGSVEIGGRPLDPPSPSLARSLGLAVVYQHHTVLEDLSVAENLALAMPRERRPKARGREAWARQRLRIVDADIDPDVRVSELSIAQRQLVELARALALDSSVLLLDEPTESLTRDESQRLFDRIASITAAGTAVVYVSHRLPEVMRIADRVTVLRDGKVRGAFGRADVTEAGILELIAGREIDRVFPPKPGAAVPAEAPDAPAVERPPLLDVRGLSGPGFTDVDLRVSAGEVVGLAGIEGNGQRELLRSLAGLEPVRSGTVAVVGSAMRPGDPTRSIEAGLVHLPGDRHHEGLVLSLSVRENITLLALDALSRARIIDSDGQARMASERVAALGVRTPSIETPVASLSGGNQQKVLIGRSMLADPKVLLADEPTRGVDMGARVEVYRLLRESAADGRGIVVLSSDALELQGLCDRVLVLSRGRVVRELEGDSLTEAAIAGAAVTADTERTTETAADRRLARVRRFFAGDYAPSLVLATLIVLLGAIVTIQNDRFLSPFNIETMLLLASALILVSLGQQVVIVGAGFDLSVGALMGLTVIVLSYLAVAGSSPASFVAAFAIAVALGIVIGLVNGTLVRIVKLAPVLATLATLFVLGGIALLLRPIPGGFIDRPLLDLITTTVGPVPVCFVVVIVVTLVAEWLLRRSRAGLALRAVGSNEERARRLGVRVDRTQFAAYVACSLFAVAGGVLLAAQVGTSDAALGGTYTLASITAVVLGGASIFGGRGSFIGTFLGALLLQEIVTSMAFLRLGNAWQYWLPGILVLVAAAMYSRARGVRTSALAGGG
jgi:ribose transport system ATP-binding protein